MKNKSEYHIKAKSLETQPIVRVLGKYLEKAVRVFDFYHLYLKLAYALVKYHAI